MAKQHPVAVRLYRDSCLAHLRERFMRDSNPLWVWLAYRVMRSRQASSLDREVDIDETYTLPTWIAAYFDLAAERLVKGEKLEEALGFATPGGRSKRRQFEDAERDVWIFAAVDSYMASESAEEVEPEDAEWLFAPLDQGESKLDRVCDHVAQTFHKRGYGSRIEVDERTQRRKRVELHPLSIKTVKDIYFRLKPKDE